MKAQGTMKELRKDLTDFVENYIDSMDIDEAELNKIVKAANDLYKLIKSNQEGPDPERLALTMFIIASQDKKMKIDPYEFAGYA
tara:strand:- start:379 stop:630 length:252 start_codon:yes stop_codon:yes gene_type:complete